MVQCRSEINYYEGKGLSMALVYCPECLRHVSDQAKIEACPECFRPFNIKEWLPKEKLCGEALKKAKVLEAAIEYGKTGKISAELLEQMEFIPEEGKR